MSDLLTQWIVSAAGSTASSWWVLSPMLVVFGFLLVSLAVFGVRCWLGRGYHDEEVARRGATALLGMWARQYFAWLMRLPLRLLRASGIPATAVTLLSLQLGVGAAAAAASGHVGLGGWLFVAAGACDFLDGRLARTTGTSTRAGAVLDSVVDRYVEGVLYVGLAWLYRDSWVLLSVLLALFGSMLVPYVRARGEALGVPMAQVGMVQRPERIVVLALGLCLSPLIDSAWQTPPGWPRHPLVGIAVTFLAAATQASSVQRLLHASGALADPRAPRARIIGRSSVARSILAAAVATALDFLAVVVMLQVLRLRPPVATLLGCGVGAVANFLINRLWTFASAGHPVLQASRYVLVSAGSAFLNSGLVALALLLPAMPPLVAWVLARGLVFTTWNYPLHRDYVFTPAASGSLQPAEAP